MTLSDEVLDEAYAIFEQWRPKRHVPCNERLATRFSTLTPERIEWLLGRMEDVSKTVRTGGVGDRFVPARALPLGIGANTDRRSVRPAACQE